MERHVGCTKPLIAVIDDDCDDLLLIREAFTASGFSVEVMCFSSQADFEEYIEDQSPTTRVPQLIIVDLYTPAGSTIELIGKLRTLPYYETIPVLMLSGAAVQTDIRRFYRNGGNTYVCKPISFEKWRHIARIVCEYWFRVAILPETRA